MRSLLRSGTHDRRQHSIVLGELVFREPIGRRPTVRIVHVIPTPHFETRERRIDMKTVCEMRLQNSTERIAGILASVLALREHHRVLALMLDEPQSRSSSGIGGIALHGSESSVCSTLTAERTSESPVPMGIDFVSRAGVRGIRYERVRQRTLRAREAFDNVKRRIFKRGAELQSYRSDVIDMWRRDQMMHPGPSRDPSRLSTRQQSRMEWRAAGAQFYPGGAYEQLSEISYRGRGPKGYTRADELLKEIICEQLTDNPFIDASDVSVDVEKGEVTLRGTVRDRRQKYAIEDLIADVSGVNEIHNYLSVADNDMGDA